MNNTQSSIDPMLAKASRYDAASVIAVTRKLLLSAPRDLDSRGRAALQGVRDAAAGVQQVLTDRERASSSKTKPTSVDHANAWNALYGRVAAAARLPGEVLSEASTAQQLLDAYFKDGLSFLTGSFEAVWVEAERKLARFDDEKATPDFKSVAGAAYLAHVRTTHQALGDALGLVGEPHPFADGTALAGKITDASGAIAKYARVLLAEVDESDEASVRRHFDALAALIEHRQSFRHAVDGAPAAMPAPSHAEVPAATPTITEAQHAPLPAMPAP